MSEWKECKLGEFISLEYGKSLRDYQGSDGKYPVYGTNGKIGKTDRFLSSIPSIIIGRKGAYRGVHFSQLPFYVIDTAFYVKTKSDEIDLLFLYNFFLTQDINAMDSGSAIPSTDRYEIYELVIKLPPLAEQRAIASMLSSLDNKIDLLHRQNKTLEAMAETLFRQWFVEETDETKQTTLEAFADNIKVIAKVVDLKTHEHYVGLEHIPRKSIALSSWGDTGTLESNKSVFEKNDILFGKLRSYFHKVVFAPIQGVCSTDILVIRPKKPEFFSFCLFWFFNKDVVEHSDLGSGGTRMPRTNWEIISSYRIPVPDLSLIAEFDKIVRPMIDKITSNVKQIHSLEKLRDTLLPKLMSGEVRVAV